MRNIQMDLRSMIRRIACTLLVALTGFVVFLPSTVSAASRTDLTVGVRLEPPHLDPTAGAAAAIGEIVYANVFEGLTRIDRSGRVQPALAASWDISDDGKTYVFHLRTNATFHDGVAFSSNDVKYSRFCDRQDHAETSHRRLSGQYGLARRRDGFGRERRDEQDCAHRYGTV